MPPSSFSCSILTASTRSTMAIRLALSACACLRRILLAQRNYAYAGSVTYSTRLRRASSPSFSMTSLVRLGLMLRTSSGSYSSSPGAISTRGLSLGMIMVPLLLRLPSLGLAASRRPRVGISSSDELVESGGEWEDIDGGSLKASMGAELTVYCG